VARPRKPNNRIEESNLKQTNQEEPGRQHQSMRPFRCLCGSMLARLVPGGVELKCRRCKRQVVVPLVEDRTKDDE
jgi:phage FluMu protein Com